MSINNRMDEIQHHMWRMSDSVQEKMEDIEDRLPARKDRDVGAQRTHAGLGPEHGI
jgi:hypothetical protein